MYSLRPTVHLRLEYKPGSIAVLRNVFTKVRHPSPHSPLQCSPFLCTVTCSHKDREGPTALSRLIQPRPAQSLLMPAAAACRGGYRATPESTVNSPRRMFGEQFQGCVLLLQDLLQSCSRGGGRRVEDMCYERRRAEACVD